MIIPFLKQSGILEQGWIWRLLQKIHHISARAIFLAVRVGKLLNVVLSKETGLSKQFIPSLPKSKYSILYGAVSLDTLNAWNGNALGGPNTDPHNVFETWKTRESGNCMELFHFLRERSLQC